MSCVTEKNHAERPARGIYVSSIQDISLLDFVAVRKLYCKVQRHSDWKDCSQCLPLIQLANKILEHGICQMSNLFQTLFPNVKYQSDKAIRKLMQLPVVILFDKLRHYGIRGVALTWMKSYLSNRLQFVQYNNTCSSYKTIQCGVPQGSILGPLLFLLYINDLGNVSNILELILFADDTNVFFSHNDFSSLTNIVNCEIERLSEWFKAN